MNTTNSSHQKMTNYRWVICAMLFMATTINYMDRQVLSLTWKDFIAPEFHWTDRNYGDVAAIFSLVYAVANLLSGRFMDWIGTRRGYLWAIGIWSFGACLHAACGLATMGWLDLDGREDLFGATGALAVSIASVSAWFFIVARIVLAVGESGNFPAAIKVTAEYFPPKDRAFSTSIFNSGSTVGALIAPLCIPLLAHWFREMGIGGGWEMAFIIIGGLGFVWLGLWLWIYRRPEECKHVNQAELDYIRQGMGGDAEAVASATESPSGNREEQQEQECSIPISRFLRLPQAWAIFLAKMVTDGVWWFFLFWTPAYISDVYHLKSDNPTAMALIFVLYAITMLSLYGGKLPTIIMQRTGLNAYEARLKAMFLFTLLPLLTLFAQPLGAVSYWFPVILIGLAGASHQAWSANLFSVASDLFPRKAVGTMTGINGMAGGISSYAINKISGHLFDYAAESHMTFLGFEGKAAGYFIIFIYCALAYLAGWCILKALVPHFRPVKA